MIENEVRMAELAAEQTAQRRVAIARIDAEAAKSPDLLSVIAAAARDPQVDVAKMQQLLDMRERVMKFEAEREFNAAMRACQEQITAVVRDAKNTHTGSMYARLETVDRTIRPIYTSHGFSLSFNSGAGRKGNGVLVTCAARHITGHTQSYELEGDLDLSGAKGVANKTSIQGLGSTVSYLRRYLTMMIFNVTTIDREDDDHMTHSAVSAQQASNITDMLNAAEITGDRLKRFLEFAQAESVETIAAFRYEDVMARLRAAARQTAGPGFSARAAEERQEGA